MTDSARELPEGLHDFLGRAGWGEAAVDVIPGDASFRRYFRIARPSGDKAMLMHAPPPRENPAPFLNVAQWLHAHQMRAPKIYASEPEAGWVLLEDFGNDRMRDWLDAHPEAEEDAYRAAIDALVELHRRPAGPFSAYDMDAYLHEVHLLPQWYADAQGLDVDTVGYEAAWREVLAPLIDRQGAGVTVLRDYHAENIMLLGGSPAAPQGIIDFQDALVGHRAYDLVSLLQDARRDVDQNFATRMLEYYRHQAGEDGEDFLADYAALGAQRNAKIVGIFTRLFKRDEKPRYLGMIPRVWGLLEQDLEHPALGPVADWFDANIPEELRARGGGTIA
ncbi:MAG: phosphotransferase [Erythrobacter sp.]|uniref:aminoglycoside phosphotransferase family protein n=1 Tax=Erythrobacter sp. TaxID=1042 RepID=UPI00262B0926|nr:phosphotransferase [Erythrobacter sp.]MDJ0977384.1 phosphotransferase [Erythrobacter sp.]